MLIQCPLRWPSELLLSSCRRSFRDRGKPVILTLQKELQLMGGYSAIATSNQVFRGYTPIGIPPSHPGVTLFVTTRIRHHDSFIVREYLFWCDRYLNPLGNFAAITEYLKVCRRIRKWDNAIAQYLLDRYLVEENITLNWWIVLGIDRNAPLPDIKKAYREAARTTHPDRGGDRAKFETIQTAYEQATARF